jgi:hypothetical protein
MSSKTINEWTKERMDGWMDEYGVKTARWRPAIYGYWVGKF